MMNAMEEFEKSMKKIKVGDIVKGIIALVKDNELIISIGYKADGVVYASDLDVEDGQSLTDIYKVDQEIEVYVTKLDDGDGNVLLSKSRVDNIKNEEELKLAFDEKRLVNVKVTEVVKGGLIGKIFGKRAFIPGSQISCHYVKDLSQFVGESFDFQIIELDMKKSKLVLSRRELERAEVEAAKKKLFDSLAEGEKVSGKVTKLEKYGAFVDIGGVEGLLHISEMAWEKVKNPADLVKVGDAVDVTIISLDMDKQKIGLSLKDVKENPWTLASEKYHVGDIITGKVVRLADYGAFVKLEAAIDAFCHVSQIKEERVMKASDALEIGQEIRAKIINMDIEKQRIGLSIKEVKEDEERAEIEEYMSHDEEQSMGTIGELFGDLFKK